MSITLIFLYEAFTKQFSVFNSKQKLAFILGLKTTVYLADLISKEEYFKTNGLLVDRWFFNTEHTSEDTTLSPHEQRNALKLLKEHNIVETKIQGIPAKTHF